MFSYQPKTLFSYLFKKNVEKKFSTFNFSIFSFYYVHFDNDQYTKFDVLEIFISNNFISEKDKNEFILLFNKTKTLYYLFKRKINFLKNKKILEYDNQLDLKLQPLSNYSNKYIFTLYHENMKYKFLINDLLRIIYTNLTNSDNLFTLPCYPKNPFNNIPFYECNLYNLYFYLREKNIVVPEYFYLFFKSGFDLITFHRNNECYLRNIVISKYHESFSNDELYEEIIIMLREFKPYHKIYLHINYEKNKVIEKILPIMKIYWNYVFSFNPEISNYNFRKLLVKLKYFHRERENNLFGRVFKKRYQRNNDEKFTINNLLSIKIPNFNNLENIINFMK